jgi:hypothetical protein
VLALLAALALVPAATGSVERGTVIVNRGGAGVTLGMTRAAVVDRLGTPLYQNTNGYMEYSRNNLFDVYLNTVTKKVRLIGISGKRFCIAGAGVCMFTNGGVAKLETRYGSALKVVTEQDGTRSYEVRGRLGGRQVFTNFTPAPGGKIIQIFIGYR